MHHDNCLFGDLRNSIEGQIAAISDDISYCSHDIEDSVRAGELSLGDLLSCSKIKYILEDVMCSVHEHLDGLDEILKARLLSGALIGYFIEDVVNISRARISDMNPKSPNDVRKADNDIIVMSNDVCEFMKNLKSHLYNILCFSNKARARRVRYVNAMDKLINLYLNTMYKNSDKQEIYYCIPEAYYNRFVGKLSHRRIIVDYISSMTEDSFYKHYKRFFLSE